jgi:hypothetical protein
MFQTTITMIPKVLIALPLLCHTAFSRAVPLRANAKFDLVGLAAPVPVSTPVSDWQKDGEVAEWAEGYPKQWGSEAVKYTQVEVSYIILHSLPVI